MQFRFVLQCGIVLVLGTAGSVRGQTRIVTGKVTDSLTSEAITTGQVSVQGTTVGTTIKEDGTFTIAAPARDVTLMIRSIGYKRMDVRVPPSQNSVQAALARDYFQLETMVVTGQATGVERRNLANSVATVSSDELLKAPTTNIEQSLQGKLAGAQITQMGGEPGSGVVVRLRGVTTINGAYTPLYVVTIPPGTNMITQSSPGAGLADIYETSVNRISDLNPGDIESIEVLKGASGSALYGSKAANGVILITTKRGRIGAPRFRVTQRFGLSHMSRQIGNRMFTSAAEAASIFGPQAAIDFNAVGGIPFDHEKQLAGGTPLSHETGASVSGGTETSRYFASGLVKRDKGIVLGTFADKQSLRVNLDQDVGRLSFTVGTEATHSRRDPGLVNNENNGSSYWSAFAGTPNFFDFRAVCPDGSRQVQCAGGIYPRNPYGNSNPLHTASEYQAREHVWRTIGTARATLNAVTGPRHTLRLIVNGGADFFAQRNAIFSPPDLQYERVKGLPGTAVNANSQNLSTNLNANVVHTYKMSGSSATTQLGVQYEAKQLNIDRILGENLVGGLPNPQTGTTLLVETRAERVRDLGLFAQEEFLTLSERLLLTAGVRADQSSASGDPTKLYYYPKASASYHVSKHLYVQMF